MTMEGQKEKEDSNCKACLKKFFELWLTLTYQEAIQLPLSKLDKIFKIILKC